MLITEENTCQVRNVLFLEGLATLMYSVMVISLSAGELSAGGLSGTGRDQAPWRAILLKCSEGPPTPQVKVLGSLRLSLRFAVSLRPRWCNQLSPRALDQGFPGTWDFQSYREKGLKPHLGPEPPPGSFLAFPGSFVLQASARATQLCSAML